MSIFTDLCDDVYTITNRPDLINETKLAVKAATLKIHQSDYYYRDLIEQGIAFLTSDYIQQFDIYSLFPNYRALKYIRRYDNSGTGAAIVTGKFLVLLICLMLMETIEQV